VNISTPYANNANCRLTSAPFRVDQVQNVYVSFWLRYLTESGLDGLYLQYSTNGTDLNIFGTVNDPIAVNWYNLVLQPQGQPGWTGNSNGWKFCSNILNGLGEQSGSLWFRFVFISNHTFIDDGVSIENFSITPGPGLDLSVSEIISPSSGCGLGMEPVSIKIINQGNDTVNTPITVSYSKNSGSPVSEVINPSISPGSEYIHTFTTLVNLTTSNDVNFLIKANVQLPGDTLVFNNGLQKTILSKVIPSAPILTNVSVMYGNPVTVTAVSTNEPDWYYLATGGTSFASGWSVNLPPVFDTITLYSNTTALNGCISSMSSMTVTPFLFSLDAGIVSLETPISPCPNLTHQTVTVFVRNFGITPLENFNLGYCINNGSPVIEPYSGPVIAMLDSAVFTFNSTFIVPHDTFELNVFSQLSGDMHSANDTLSANYQVTPFCQPVGVKANLANIIPAPDTSLVITICQGTMVQFDGYGVYPGNDSLYHQSDSTSIFIWDFGDGTTDTGKLVQHVYSAANMYVVGLRILDSNHCEGMNAHLLKVKIAPGSFVNVSSPLSSCVGIPVDINVGVQPANTIQFNTTGNILQSFTLYDSATFIPDGGALGGLDFELPIEVTNAPFGAQITSANDIQSISINMEQSFVGDLDITLICPNGTEIVLLEYIHSGSAYLGEPFGGTNHASFDCSGPPSCISDPLMNPAGTGYTYTFSMNPQYQTMQSYANSGNMPNPPFSVPVLDSSSYLPFQSFQLLAGCPVNGTWILKVGDYWDLDNGWVFWWQLNLEDSISPVLSYTVAIDTVAITGPNIFSSGQNQVTIIPQAAGNFTYQVQINDDFGCTYDTSIMVNVSSELIVVCSSDTGIFMPAPVSISAIAINGLEPLHYLWSNGSTAPLMQVNPLTTTTYYVTITDATGCFGVDSVTVAIGVLPSLEPMLRNELEWSVYSHYFLGFPVFNTSHYKVSGDSVINTVEYKKIWVSQYPNPVAWDLHFLAREEGSGKVFAYNPNGSGEYLLFDFSLNPGDSAFIYSGFSYEQWVKAAAKDTIYVGGSWRERIFIESSVSPVDIWVNGLGSMIWGPQSRPAGFVGSIDTVICIHENNSLIFQKPGFTTCHLENVGIAETGEQSLILYPNPVEDVSVFQTSTAINGPVVLTVYDVLGRLSKTIKESGLEQIQIRHSDFRPGVYFFRISFNQKEFCGKFMNR